MSQEAKIGIGVCLGLLVLACCCAAVVAGAGGLLFFQVARSTEFAPILTEIVRVTPDDFLASPTPTPNIVRTPVPTPLPGASDTLEALRRAVIPPSDLRVLAMRLKGIADIPETVSDTPADHAIGTELDFNVSNSETSEVTVVTARLVYKTENVYFFADTGVDVDEQDVRALVDHFQNDIYPTDREFFGSEWNPGVDGDPRLYILYTRGLGSNAFTITVGYYSSRDEYARLANEYSNEKEIFYLNADYAEVGSATWPSTLAHEFQHMINWHYDRNEETWLSEGSADLAELINDYDVGSHDDAFVENPDLQLNTWTEGGPDDNTLPHYGAAFLFMAYFLDRFGEDATKALVATDTNGLASVDEALTATGAADARTGQPITALEVFADWVVANYLNDPGVADGRYAYYRHDNVPALAGPTERLRQCPAEVSSTVSQFAADYYEIACEGRYTLTFSGSQQVQVIPTMPNSGRYAFWGHRNDESVTALTREFDFSGLSTVTLNYAAWWEIEDDYDYAYLEVSTDGGQTFGTIETPHTTDYNPNGSNFGWGYTADSGGGASRWVQESVDLSAYAGQKVLVRFEYITDAAVNRAGFMLDDVAIPELSYATDFESDDGGWQAQGFVRMDNLLPQTFIVQLIRQGAATTVERVALDANNQAQLALDIAAGDPVVLVVSGSTPFTTQAAGYQFAIER